jgi:AraC-like DNA-binding protein
MRDIIYTGKPEISPENFDPRVLYILKEEVKDKSSITYTQRDFTTLIYILSGSCTYSINDTLYKVEKGDAIICGPGSTHKKILNYGDRTLEFNTGFNNIHLKNLPKNQLIATDCPVVHLHKYGQDFLRCCEEIISEHEKNDRGFELVLKALVMKLIAILLKELYAGEKPDEDSVFSFELNDRSNIVNTIVGFINGNYMNEISLERLSKNMYLSPVYISKIFKEETGESPINHLIKVRLTNAKLLLGEGRLSIKEVAKRVGYDDAYYFSKLFKKYYGYPPSRHKDG